ncbi:hypothetical protein CANINC_002344 [Pichia inconspicua]|uniref:Aminopeptidase n=1 Tax=Pichia inconspicua TaxID=52247 RepID=A0A4T0X1D3_9ASCO|nr:hypothetical protein CANINC_002344 [[Candida] inconspicua]
MFSNRLVPAEYSIALSITDSKPNYSGKVVIPLIQNSLFNKSLADNLDHPADFFTITLNTAEIVSLNANLKYGNQSWRLSQTTDKESQLTKYFSTDVHFADIDPNLSQISLEIGFLAKIRKILTYSDITKGAFSTKYTDPITGKLDRFLLSTHCQPHFAKYIFPCLDEIVLKCPIQLELTVDNKYTCISNQQIESSKFVSETSMKIVKFEKTPPMAVSVFSFAVGDFEFIENTVELPISKKTLPLKIYTMVGETKRASFALEVLSKAIVELECLLNYPYPLPKLDVVSVPFLSDGGVENWSMIQIINDQILLPDWKVSDSQLKKQMKTITEVISHEIVHMYIGNLVTFDSYDYTWLNESFATFTSTTIINKIFDNNAWFDYINDNLNSVKLRNLAIDSKPIATINVKVEHTHDTFNRNSYDKGIFLLRTLASLFNETNEQLLNENYSTFFEMIGDFIKLFKYNTFKPIDLWNFLKNHSSNKYSYDIPTIMNSWIRTPGFPRLIVSKEKSGSIKIEQHRCLEEITQDIEDVPFHIPLLIKTIDGKIGRHLITDRSLIISNENLDSNFLFINANDAAMLYVEYPTIIAKEIAINFNLLNRTEQLAFFHNFAAVIGTEYQTNESITSFFEVFKAIKKINKHDPVALTFGISILSNLYQSIKTLAFFQDEVLLKKLNLFIDELCNKYVSQLDLENTDWTNLSSNEIKLRNAVLSLKYDNHSIQTIGKKLFKRIMHGPKNSVPMAVLSSTFNIVAQSCLLKDYKEIHKLIRNPGLVVNNVIENNSNAVQTAAISCLGHMIDPELRYKTLMFVKTNPDVKLIELAVLGFRYQMSTYTELWKWYLSNYTVWYSKFSRDNTSDQGLFFKHISELVFECACYDPSLKMEAESFVSSKSESVKVWYQEALDKLETVKFLSQANEQLKSLL